MRLSRAAAAVLLPLLALSVPAVSLAQKAADVPPVPGLPGVPLTPPAPAPPYPDGVSSCFEYYNFGSVSVEATPSLDTAATGADIAFSGSITNQNAYPIVGATVYVKIFRLSAADKSKNVYGPDVVGFFPAVENLTLKAGETKPISFLWHVPSDAQAGDYEAGLYVGQAGRFELSGLSFTDDVVSSYVPFAVVGGSSGAVEFVKSGVTVGGAPYRFAAYAPVLNVGSSSIPVTAQITNTSPMGYQGSVSWQLYYWDSQLASHLIASSSEPLSLNPGSTTSVSYEVSDTAHAVYYLVGTVRTSGGSQSLIAARFVRSGVPEARFSDVGVSAYPLGGGGKAFACFHSTSAALASSVSVNVSVRAPGLLFGNRLVASSSYAGVAPGALTALAVPVAGAFSSFTVTASLYQDGKLIDKVTVPYDCKTLGGTCENSSLVPIAAVAAALLLIIVLGLVFFRRRHDASSPLTPPSP